MVKDKGMNLYNAAAAGNLAECRRLLAAGVPVNTVIGGVGLSALMTAALNGHLAVAALLVDEEGASINKTDKFGITPLMNAVYNNHAAMVVLLLENGASANASNPPAGTALSWAAQRGCDACVRALLDATLLKGVAV